MRRIALTYLLFLSVLLPLCAQSSVDSVALRAMQVGRVMQQERVYLHFDNTAYYLGETMWFKAYVSFGADNRPSRLSKVLYVELVAPEGYVVETKKYKLDDNGCCHGEFELKPLLLSGYYEVRAYTRYMLNWGKDAVFSRVFPVFDKVNADNWDFKNMLDRRRAFMQDGKWISHELPDVTLDFYPESGHLVGGLPSRVAFELREGDGLFSEEKIRIYKNNELVVEALPVHQGKGVFELTPETGAKYHAEVTVKSKKGKSEKYKFSLPEVAEEGVVMSVSEAADSIKVDILNNLSEPEELGFVVLHRGTMGFYKKFSGKSGSMHLSFGKSELPEGVNRAVLFADDKAPLAERQFFVKHDTLHNTTQETVGLRLVANGYHLNNLSPSPNEKITLKIVRNDGKPLSKATNLSLAISDALGTQATSYSHNIYTYMLLGSELKGYIPDAMHYFNPSNENRKEHLDLIMLTHGWTSYSWQNLARRKINDIQPIERGITVKGNFFQKRRERKFGHIGEVKLTAQPYNLVRLDYASDSTNVKMSTFRTDSAGGFVLELDDFYGTRIASLKPQTVFKHSRDISYHFALDRYYSPGFRLYDYWERNLGTPMSKAAADSLVKLNPFEYMLSSVEVVAKKNNEINSRPPHSEIRLNYLDEWEYAQDVTYLNMFETHRDALYEAVLNEVAFPGDRDENKYVNGEKYDSVQYEAGDVISLYKSDNSTLNKYIGNIRYSSGENKSPDIMPVNHEYDHVLTAADVVRSAIKRHGYYWAYWVQLMVVDGEYSSFTVPTVDMQYLRGTPDVEKMTNFKEFVIRCDEKTRSLFENRDNYWRPLTFMMDNKIPLQKFYNGFLSQLYVYPDYDMSGAPEVHAFGKSLTGGHGVYYPVNPNYVACLIPYTAEERSKGVVPEYAAAGSSMRYTSVQGYSESKQFYSPDYSRMKPQEKDYRRTLLWQPVVTVNDSGEAVVEFYNSDVCNAFVATIEGRQGNVLFSNSDIMETRVSDKPDSIKESRNIEKKESLIVETNMDSVLMAQCASELETGLVYYNQKRYKNAIMFFAELVQYQYPPALYYVSKCYRDGTGVAKNDKLALSFLLEAAKRNEPRAQYELAMECFDGKIVKRDKERGFEWLEYAVQNKEPRALFDMALRRFEGNGYEKDSLLGYSLLEQAAILKNPEAMYLHGMYLLSKGDDGIPFIREAAQQKNVNAMLYISDYDYQNGNYEESFKYAKLLSMLGYHKGTKRMADCYLEGKGVKCSRKIAKELYRDAAVAGNKEALDILRSW